MLLQALTHLLTLQLCTMPAIPYYVICLLPWKGFRALREKVAQCVLLIEHEEPGARGMNSSPRRGLKKSPALKD